MLEGSRSMRGREMTRIMIEGALNGIGFVIGSAVVGWIFLHGSAVLAFAVLVIVLWVTRSPFLSHQCTRHLFARSRSGEEEKRPAGQENQK